MAALNWPSDLPQAILAAGYQRSPQSGRVASQTDSGPAKIRRRFTARVKSVTGMITVDATGQALFWDFYDNTLGLGVLRFNWTDPIGGAAVEMRFTPNVEPTEAAAQGSNGAEPGLVTITLPLDIMP